MCGCVYVECLLYRMLCPCLVRSGGLFWLKPVAMVLFMLCSAVLID